jgi:hypothetical protein
MQAYFSKSYFFDLAVRLKWLFNLNPLYGDRRYLLL